MYRSDQCGHVRTTAATVDTGATSLSYPKGLLRRCMPLNILAEPHFGIVLALIPALTQVRCYRLKLASLLLSMASDRIEGGHQ
jgi:hypothetical protein